MQYICNFIKHKCSFEAITFLGLNSPLSPGLENLPTAIFFDEKTTTLYENVTLTLSNTTSLTNSII